MEKNDLIRKLSKRLKDYSGKPLKFMEVCGTHTMSIFKHGIRKMLPDSIKLISGPGCPVCVTPQGYIDQAIELAKRGVITTTFGDMIRIPGSSTSLEQEKAMGSDVRVVYSPLDSLKIAAANPEKKVVFLAVGFETTIPVIALTVKKAKEMGLENFFILTGMKLIIPALEMLCTDTLEIDGFLLPGHVSAIIGQECYGFLANDFGKACCISGFEAEDILLALSQMVNQIENSDFKIENAYKRVVKYDGNLKANNIIFEVFEPEDSLWRGIGEIKNSGLKLKEGYKGFDAREKFNLGEVYEVIKKGCLCGEVIKGTKVPYDCKLFDKACNPMNPVGACMVSSEGTCAAYYKYGRK